MAQYYEFTDTTTGLKTRIGAREVTVDEVTSVAYVEDKELTETGFAGVEDTDWEMLNYAI